MRCFIKDGWVTSVTYARTVLFKLSVIKDILKNFPLHQRLLKTRQNISLFLLSYLAAYDAVKLL